MRSPSRPTYSLTFRLHHTASGWVNALSSPLRDVWLTAACVPFSTNSFLEYGSRADADEAIRALDRRELDGQRVRVCDVRPLLSCSFSMLAEVELT